MSIPNCAFDVERFRFKRPRFFTLLLVVMLVAAPVGMIAPWLSSVLSDEPWLPGLAFIIITSALLAGIVCGLRALTRPRQAPVMELHRDYAVLPVASGSKRSRQVPYEEITSLNVLGKGRWARMLVATKQRNFVYPITHFDGGPSTLETFRSALRARIAARPGGSKALRGIDERDALGTSIMQRPRRATTALLVVLGATFIWTWFSGALKEPFGLVPLGANTPTLVAEGEWYRLLSANFLHAGWLHIYLNVIGVYAFGVLLERLVGPWRFLCIFLTAAAAGALASTLAASAALSVGASTGVFGLLGAHAFINWRCRASLPGGFSLPVRVWLILLGVNAALPLVVPVIDWAAHVGGFIAGALVAVVLSSEANAGLLGRAASPRLRMAVAALVVAYVAALAQALVGTREDGEAAKLRVADAFIEQEALRPAALNAMAWQYAIKPDLTEAELALAERAASRAVGLASTNAAFIETLATLHYRARRFDAAVTTQRQALLFDDRAALVSQMARFLDARFAEGGPFALGGIAPEGIDVRLERSDEGAPALVVDLAEGVDRGLEIYAIDKRGDRVLGTMQLLIGPGMPAGPHRLPFRERTQPPQADRLIVAYADATGCDCASGAVRGRYVPLSRGAAELPGPR